MSRTDFLFLIPLVGLSVAGLGFSVDQARWEKLPLNVMEVQFTSLLVLPDQNPTILIGGPNVLYRSTQRGKESRIVLPIPGAGSQVNFLYMSQPSRIFAATDAGLFFSSNGGQAWKRIFYSPDPASRRCLSVTSDGDWLYVGTQEGLFYRKFQDTLWQQEKRFLDREVIPALAHGSQYLYVGTDRKVYRLNKERTQIKEIFALPNKENEIPADQNSAENTPISQIKQLAVASDENPTLYLATTEGIFTSTNQGETWINLHPEGLPTEDIRSLAVAEGGIFVATHKGVFQHQDGRWLPLYQGMETNQVNFLTHDHKGALYAVTDRGIFFLSDKKTLTQSTNEGPPAKGGGAPHFPTAEHPLESYARLQDYFHDEPSIGEVQEIAVRYAEVHPDKIKSWRQAAQTRSLLPTVAVNVDRSATELFHWDTGPNPDILRRGRDFLDWGVSLTWDLADFIWNPDQTSIDSRSKLMVELREDILNEITRLYFERRRLQMELMTEPPEPRSQIDKEMRLEELTALIDGLTGGEFSRLQQK